MSKLSKNITVLLRNYAFKISEGTQTCHQSSRAVSVYSVPFQHSHQCPRRMPTTFMKSSQIASFSDVEQMTNYPRWFSTESNNKSELDEVTYERVVSEALEDLTERFESLEELECCPSKFDVQYADGVLTVFLGPEYGTYVINKQTPNKQIWLSSPKSGPKRYDFSNGRWIYTHDDTDLHTLLTEEISEIFKESVDFTQLWKDS